jgi:hypothetical protein
MFGITNVGITTRKCLGLRTQKEASRIPARLLGPVTMAESFKYVPWTTFDPWTFVPRRIFRRGLQLFQGLLIPDSRVL